MAFRHTKKCLLDGCPSVGQGPVCLAGGERHPVGVVGIVVAGWAGRKGPFPD